MYHRPIGELSKGFRQRVGAGRGHPPPARPAGAGRADRGARPQPAGRDPPADRPAGPGANRRCSRPTCCPRSSTPAPACSSSTAAGSSRTGRWRSWSPGPRRHPHPVEVAGAGIAERLGALPGVREVEPRAGDDGRARVTLLGRRGRGSAAADLRPGQARRLDALRAAPGGRQPGGPLPRAHHRPGARMRRDLDRRAPRAAGAVRPSRPATSCWWCSWRSTASCSSARPTSSQTREPAADAGLPALGVPLLRARRDHAGAGGGHPERAARGGAGPADYRARAAARASTSASVLFLWIALALTWRSRSRSRSGADCRGAPSWRSTSGAALLTAGLAGVGVWASSLTRSQITAFILAVGGHVPAGAGGARPAAGRTARRRSAPSRPGSACSPISIAWAAASSTCGT